MSTADASARTGITGVFRGVKSATPKYAPKHFRASPVRWQNNGEVYVMDNIKLAMLGSKEAARRLTDAGVKLRNFLN